MLPRPPMSSSNHCALARANPVLDTDEGHIRTQNTVIDKSRGGWICSYPRSPIARGRLFVRAQSVIRADGPPSAQVHSRSPMHSPASADAGARPLRAPRANHVFGTDERHIRAENTVIDNNKDGLDLFFVGRRAHQMKTGP